MNTPLQSVSQQAAEMSYTGKSRSSKSSKKNHFSEDEKAAFSTIDGSVITFKAGASAVSNGIGIFIGDYFVGVTDHILSSCNTPFVRY